MRKLSATATLATIAILLALPAAFAQGTGSGTGTPSTNSTTSPQAAPPRGTNSAGTAQSSGNKLNTGEGVTTGSAHPKSVDQAITNENTSVDRRLKGICRGC
ncbi:hypothetical protein [Bradyrhizobium jicamae]|uniref:hypothetical protein n=1 Tax=Bradyrhizobium jicamae TaxID=280332 RepID=UPI001BA4C258|nr:hypothetical protein [Bradyrhizobium jicamae]MBR0937357.1 hypothetical protein [Bradyrhizobium jicamae]